MHKLLFYFMISLISAEIGEGKEGIYIFMLFHPGCQPSSSLSFPSIPPPFNCWVSTPFTEYRVLVLNGTAIPGKAHGNLNILTSLHVTVPNCVFLFYIIVIGFVKPHTQKKNSVQRKKIKILPSNWMFSQAPWSQVQNLCFRKQTCFNQVCRPVKDIFTFIINWL